MKATVDIIKSFDEGKKFSKTYESGDFKEFFADEGKYLDNLSGIMAAHGDSGDEFTVTYTVKVVK